MPDTVAVDVAHSGLDIIGQNLGVPFSGESDGLVLLAEGFQDEIHDARASESLIDVLERVPLLEHLGKIFMRILVWLHDRENQFLHQNTPTLH